MTKQEEKIYKIVAITWLDACFYPDQTGTIEEILLKAKLREVIDMGWLIGEDEDKYLLACTKKEGKRFNKITAIAKSSVKEIKELHD